jgi:hypothetical protein
MFVPEIGHFLAKYSSARLPYPPARNKLQNLELEYRTLRQINTVLSNKKLPYSPTNQRVLRASLRPDESIGQELPANPPFLLRLVLHGTIPYSPTSFTVLSHKEYRTLQQGIPYSPTSFTVLSDKLYRTPQQNIPYSPASGDGYLPANSDKASCDEFALSVIVFC